MLINIVVGLVILVGIIGAVIQIIPSGLLVGAAILVWAITVNTGVGWVIFALSAVVLVVAAVLKYVIPGKRLINSSTPNRVLLLAALVGVAGWFIVPVIGFVIGAVGSLYLLERNRLGGHEPALASVKELVSTLGLTITIELVAALLAATFWIIGLFVV